MSVKLFKHKGINTTASLLKFSKTRNTILSLSTITIIQNSPSTKLSLTASSMIMLDSIKVMIIW